MLNLKNQLLKLKKKKTKNSLKNIWNINKPNGLTPLEALSLLRLKYLELANKNLTYAGRLDPLASGVMLVLAGEEVKNKQEYLNLNKVYEFSVLFGLKTDTGDILGLVSSFDQEKPSPDFLKKDINKLVGSFKQNYPKYSSPRISGLKQFSKQVEIFDLKFKGVREISGASLLENIERRIGVVDGDFRQAEILKVWQETLEKYLNHDFLIADVSAVVSSGVYIRTLSERVGELVSKPALAFKIRRTAVGDFKIADSVSVD